MSAGDFLKQQGFICPEPDVEARKILEGLRKQYAKKKPASSVYIIDYTNKTYSREDFINYLKEQEIKKGFAKEEAEKRVNQLLIDSGIIEGEKSKPATTASDENKASSAADQKSTATESVYANIDLFNVAKMAEKAGLGADGNRGLPSDKRFNVTVNRKALYVRTNFVKSWEKDAIQNACGFDAVEAVMTMKSRAEVVAEIERYDDTSDAAVFAAAEFSTDPRFKADAELTRRRMLFLKSIAAMLCRQDILEAVAGFAQKKKDGTFYKNRITRIASSMVAEYPNIVFEIVGRVTKDDTLTLSFEAASATEETLFKSESDFLSTHQELFDLSAYRK